MTSETKVNPFTLFLILILLLLSTDALATLIRSLTVVTPASEDTYHSQ